MFSRKINLQDPLQGRKWLQLLEADPECGYLLKPNLKVPKTYMGFSVDSNPIGLRGPSDSKASNVIFGTSFAMGIAVDIGRNWWEVAALDTDWLNLGLAVGINEWGKLLARYNSGPKQKAILLYHPNIWVHCLMYERWRNSGKDVFTALRWKRSITGCLYLSLKRRLQRSAMLRNGRMVRFTEGGERFEIDTRYCYLDADLHTRMIDRNLNILAAILEQFHQVCMIRIPIKNELIPGIKKSKMGGETIQNYEHLWNATQYKLRCLKNFKTTTWQDARLNHFHPMDTHWNSHGNQSFAEFIGAYCV